MSTPGPWTIETDEWCEAQGTVKGIYGPGGERIICTDSGMYPPETEDAHLIAAAPDLLEALKRCIDVLVFVDPSSAVPAEALRMARSAVAKAEGDK